jgi:hypothetical protein
MPREVQFVRMDGYFEWAARGAAYLIRMPVLLFTNRMVEYAADGCVLTSDALGGRTVRCAALGTRQRRHMCLPRSHIFSLWSNLSVS